MMPPTSTPTAADVRALLGRLSLSQTETARLLGTESRSVRRWLAGARGISGPAWMMLALFERAPETIVIARTLADEMAGPAPSPVASPVNVTRPSLASLGAVATADPNR